MQNNLEVVITAKDEASAKLKGITDVAKNMGIAFGVIGGVVEAALYKTVQAATDAQEKMAQFDNTLKNTANGSVPAVRDALLKAADATLKLGFDNEEAAGALAKFYQRTGDVTDSVKLNTIAMDLARAKHIDLNTAATLVGQVLSGNGKVLKQYGINIKDSATPLQALNELHEKTKGSAEAFAASFAGQQQILGQALGELEENIGQKLLPILTDLAQRAIVVINAVKKWTDAHPELTSKIVLITAVIGSLLLVLAPLMIALPAIISFFTLLSPAVLAVVAILAGLILIIKNVIDIFDLFKNHSKEVWDGIVIIFQDAINSITNFFKPLIDLLDNVLNKISSIGSSIGSVVGKVGGAIGSGISSAYNAVASVVTGHRAQGGNVTAGNSYLVGENGAEMFTPSTGGIISSNSGGGKSINIQINGAIFSQEAARTLGDMLVKNLQRTARI